MKLQLSDWVENIVGKEEIARYEQFLIFPQRFQKLSVCWCVKLSIYGVMGEYNIDVYTYM